MAHYHQHKRERAALAEALRSFVLANFTDYAKLYSRAGVVGIPGFWQEPSGMVHVWKPRSYNMPILVIPYRTQRALSKPVSYDYTLPTFLKTAKNTVGSPLHKSATALAPEPRFTLPSDPKTFLLAETFSIPKAHLKQKLS